MVLTSTCSSYSSCYINICNLILQVCLPQNYTPPTTVQASLSVPPCFSCSLWCSSFFILYALHKRRKRGKKKYRVADQSMPDPALERLSSACDHNVLMGDHNGLMGDHSGLMGGHSIISNGKVVDDKDSDCDTIMTVMFSPLGDRLHDSTFDVDSDQGL